MLLRASSRASGETVDIRAVTDGEATPSGLPGGEALSAFAETAVRGDPGAITEARDRVVAELGAAAAVDAAAVIGNFDRMVRIADGTGIPLDKPVAMISADVRADLGIDTFGGAENTAKIRGIERVAGKVLSRMLPLVLRHFRR